MTKILFICLGNICRSTMAEYVMKDLVQKAGMEDQFYIDSAGTSDEEHGNGVHPGTRRKLAQEGIYCGNHHARQMKKSDYDEYDYLIGMENSNMRNMMRICGGDSEHKMYRLLDFSNRHDDIADPWFTGNFEDTYRDVDEGCRAFLKYLLDL